MVVVVVVAVVVVVEVIEFSAVVEHLTLDLPVVSLILIGTAVAIHKWSWASSFNTNVHPLNPQSNGYLAKDSFYSVAPKIIVVAAMR